MLFSFEGSEVEKEEENKRRSVILRSVQGRRHDVNLDIFSQVLGGNASNNLIERQEFLKLIGCSMERCCL